MTSADSSSTTRTKRETDKPQPFLKIESLQLTYQDIEVVSNISFRVWAEEIVCLLGPSGCGKTTLLKAIAGFDAPTQGKIFINETLMSSPQKVVAPANRNISMVFQDLALFPHLTVEENILLSMKAGTPQANQQRVDKLCQVLKLEHVLKKYPHTISGGEQQRTALARALAPKPPLLLLDEPLSSQDIELKQKLQLSLKSLLKSEKITTLFVTHDQDEAFALSDKMGVFHHHKMEQYGTPYDVYYQPCSRFIADFIGKGTLVNGIIEDGTLISEFGRIKKFQFISKKQDSLQSTSKKAKKITKHSSTDVSNSQTASNTTTYKRDSLNVKVLVRPDDVQLDNRSAIRAQVKERLFQGSHFLYTLKLRSGTELLSLMPSTYPYNKGEEVGIAFSFQHIVVFE